MIVGFNVESIDAGRKTSGKNGNLQVNYGTEIKDVKKADVGAIDGQVAKIDFNFTVSYTVGDQTVASISLDGNILWSQDVDDVVDYWNENDTLPADVNKPLMNDLYRKCISQSVGIADTLGLVPPVPTPRIED